MTGAGTLFRYQLVYQIIMAIACGDPKHSWSSPKSLRHENEAVKLPFNGSKGEEQKLMGT
jgi:hypothetical protein